MARQHFNGLVTTLGANLTNVATTITFTAALTFAGGTPVPTLAAGDTFRLALLSPGGVLLEVVEVTAYTSGGTTATITRAVESTTAVAHTLGDPVVSSVFGSDVHFDGVRVFRSAALAAANSVGTAVLFDAEDFDTDAFHDLVTNTSRLTVPAGLAGKYLICANLDMNNVAASSRVLLDVWKNGAASGLRSDVTLPATTQSYATVVSGVLALAAADFIELAYFTTAAAATIGSVAAAPATSLSIHRIGA